MSDMVERAARERYRQQPCGDVRDGERKEIAWDDLAAVTDLLGDYGCEYRETCFEDARNILLAALDPEDERVQFAICAGIGFVTQDGDYSVHARAQASAAVRQLRLLAQDIASQGEILG